MVLISDFSQVILFNVDHHDRVFTDRYGKEVAGAMVEGLIINTPLLEYYQQLNIKKYMFTNSNLAQGSQKIYDYLRPIFSDVWQPKDVGAQKNQTEAYQNLAQKLAIHAQEIIFVDDSPSNIQAAIEAGCLAKVYHNNQQIMKFINQSHE